MLEILAIAAVGIGIYECATYKTHNRINRATRSAIAASDELARARICKRMKRREA